MSFFVIDNGTHTIKYNFNNQDPIIRPNILYKQKNNFSFTQLKDSYSKKVFLPNHNLIVNYDIFEKLIDNCFLECNVTDKIDLILTIGLTTPSTIKREILEILMETYNLGKVQLGIDSVYSYLYNKKFKNNNFNHTFILSVSNSETHLINLAKIKEIKKNNFNQLPYGYEKAKNYLDALNNKNQHFYKIKVPKKSYRETTERILKNLRNGKIIDLEIFKDPLKNNENQSESEYKLESEPENKSESESENKLESESENKLESESENKLESESDNEPIKKENQSKIESKDESNNIGESNIIDKPNIISESKDESNNIVDKKNKMLYFSAIYRSKMRIQKIILDLKNKTSNLENLFYKKKDPKKYLENKILNFKKLKLEIEKRKNISKSLENKKSRESIIYNKFYNFNNEITKDEMEIINHIENIQFIKEDEIKLKNILNEILEMQPNFIEHLNILEILEGHALKNGESNFENLSVFRAGEAFFNPSIMNCEMPGLVEMIEDEFMDINEENEECKENFDGFVIHNEKENLFCKEEENLFYNDLNCILSDQTISISKKNIKNKKILFFITGGGSQIPFFKDRIESEIKMNLFSNMDYEILTADDVILDAFKGANFCDFFPIISDNEYIENGKYFYY